MSRRAHDDEKYDIKPFDCVSSGQVYRDFKNAALRFLAGILDESGSSLANHAIDDDTLITRGTLCPGHVARIPRAPRFANGSALLRRHTKVGYLSVVCGITTDMIYMHSLLKSWQLEALALCLKSC